MCATVGRDDQGAESRAPPVINLDHVDFPLFLPDSACTRPGARSNLRPLRRDAGNDFADAAGFEEGRVVSPVGPGLCTTLLPDRDPVPGSRGGTPDPRT